NRSTDAGVTWETPIDIPNEPIFGTLDVDSNGNLYVGGEGFDFRCARSSNAQFGNQTPVFDQVTPVNMGGDLAGGGINPGGLDGQAFLAVDHSGTATNDNVYMLASVQPPGRSTTDVMFARSTDGGATFSAPVRVNDDDNPSKWHWFGTFSVAPNGRLDAVWYDNRNANNLDSQLFYAYINTNSYSNCDTYSNRNTDSYCNTDSYGYPHNYSTANADTEDCSIAERASDSAAETVGPDLPVISEL